MWKDASGVNSKLLIAIHLRYNLNCHARKENKNLGAVAGWFHS